MLLFKLFVGEPARFLREDLELGRTPTPPTIVAFGSYANIRYLEIPDMRLMHSKSSSYSPNATHFKTSMV